MKAVVNVAQAIPMRFSNASGGKTGLTVVASARLAGSTTTVSGTVTERTGGDYDAAITFTSVGWWFFTGATTIDGLPVPWLETVEVETAAKDDPVAAITALYGALLANLDAAVSSRATPANITALQAALSASTVSVISPVDALTGDATIEQGVDETLTWTESAWPTLTGATIAFSARHEITKAVTTASGAVDVATGSGKQVSVVLSHTVTAAMTPGEYAMRVTATIAGDVEVLVLGTLTVTRAPS